MRVILIGGSFFLPHQDHFVYSLNTIIFIDDTTLIPFFVCFLGRIFFQYAGKSIENLIRGLWIDLPFNIFLFGLRCLHGLVLS